MTRQKAHKPEFIVLWGERSRTLTVGFTRAVGWEAVGNATPDGMYARFDCPVDWVMTLAHAFADFQDDPNADFAYLATHELEPPRMQTIRRIENENVRLAD